MSTAIERVAAQDKEWLSKLTADAMSDFGPDVIDETGAAKWFPMVRSALAKIMGGSSKIKVIKVTPNSVTVKFRAQGFILDHKAIVNLAALARREPELEFAVFMQNQRLYLLCVEREANG